MASFKVRIRVSPGVLRALLLSGLLAAPAVELASESFGLTTYYPAPSGIYGMMTTMGDTRLSGHVEVRRVLRLGALAGDAAADASMPGAPPPDGSLYYDTTAPGQFKARVAGAWQPLGAGSMAGVQFGGMYQFGEMWGNCTSPTQCSIVPGVNCEKPNPHTGLCTCPTGFNQMVMSRTCEDPTCGKFDENHICYK